LGDVFFENTLRGDKGDGAHGSEWTRDRSVRSEERSQETDLCAARREAKRQICEQRGEKPRDRSVRSEERSQETDLCAARREAKRQICAQRGEKPRGSGKDEKPRVRREEERPIWELTRRCQDKQKSQGPLTSRHCCCAMASAGVAARALNDRHEREASEQASSSVV
jgi:hypothetical protein